MKTSYSEERLTLVMAGHVDHGKSTVIGRLLADTNSLPEGKLEQVKETCKRNAKPFEYAFLLDALKDEQSQGITIDAARCFFHTDKRHYILIDAPGHVEFLKNMITGAARAEAALLVIDADEGIQENSKRHGYMVSMLGIQQFAVVVNKMDLVDYDQKVFDKIEKDFREFLGMIGLEPQAFVPVSGWGGDNISGRSEQTPWYDGPTVLEQIDAFQKPSLPVDFSFRFPVQDIYKFTQQDDKRRIVAGTVATGRINAGDDVVFYPSGKRSTVKNVEQFNAPRAETASAGQALGFTLTHQIYAKPGELMVRADEPAPQVGTRFRANLFWMGNAPMIQGREYKLKIGAARMPVQLVKILNVLDASELSSIQNKQQVDRHDVAECVFESAKPVAFDLISDIKQTGRFVLVDDYEIAGAGIILENVRDDSSTLQEHLDRREQQWEHSEISSGERIGVYHHDAKAVVFTGRSDNGSDQAARELAQKLEKTLFRRNFKSYYLGLNNLFLGLENQLDKDTFGRTALVRRLGELAHLFTDAGLIFITSVPDLDQYDLKTLEMLNRPNELVVVNLGDTDLDTTKVDLSLPSDLDQEKAVEDVHELLKKKEVILEYYI